MKRLNKIQSKCKKIKIVLTDVDGVLTDGGRYYNAKGESLKKFHTHDGMAISILLRNNIKTCIITKENSLITQKWAKDMKINKVYYNSINKEDKLQQICKKYNVKSFEIAFIGDDVNDLKLMKLVGLSVCPRDGIPMIKKTVDYVCKNPSGKGAFREMTDLILLNKLSKSIIWY
tara:strand:+ start:654 stop:1175 length:522 start_codon:yes stop_codon:yes gene_type:complete